VYFHMQQTTVWPDGILSQHYKRKKLNIKEFMKSENHFLPIFDGLCTVETFLSKFQEHPLSLFSTRNTEPACPLEKLVNFYQIIRRHTSMDGNIHNRDL
jgi:hypothetical protein